MDPLDIRLLRAMFRSEAFTLRGVDPRLSAQYLARRVGISRITVTRRLARWRSEGFWKGLIVYPNPDALSTSFTMQGIVLGAERDRGRLEAAIDAALEPVINFQTEDIYTPVLLGEEAARTEHRQRALEKAGVGRILCRPLPLPFVASTVRLGPRDWEIVRSLRRYPEPDWPAVAQEVGVTVRGLERRVARLMDGGALFFFPAFDFRRSPGTMVTVGLLFGPGVDLALVQAELARRYPELLPLENIFPFEMFVPPGFPSPVSGHLQFQLTVPSASSCDELRREFGMVPGVVEVIIGFPTQDYSVPSELDARIESAINGHRPGPRPIGEPARASR
jgi:DNA-binding Lrp family transcriptional regulator